MKGRRGADAHEETDGVVSRSQLRREALAVLDLALALMDGPAKLVESLQLEDDLKRLIAESRRVNQPVARKRQAQFLAKQLRRDDEAVAVIRRALESSAEDRRRDTARLHRIEHWRERLIGEGDLALEALLEDCPGVDRQSLRQLIRQARTEAAAGKAPAASRKIFRLLSDQIADSDPG
jgi:ribosome-associated protein